MTSSQIWRRASRPYAILATPPAHFPNSQILVGDGWVVRFPGFGFPIVASPAPNNSIDHDSIVSGLGEDMEYIRNEHHSLLAAKAHGVAVGLQQRHEENGAPATTVKGASPTGSWKPRSFRPAPPSRPARRPARRPPPGELLLFKPLARGGAHLTYPTAHGPFGFGYARGWVFYRSRLRSSWLSFSLGND